MCHMMVDQDFLPNGIYGINVTVGGTMGPENEGRTSGFIYALDGNTTLTASQRVVLLILTQGQASRVIDVKM